MMRLSDTSFILVLLSFLAEKVDRVAMFKQIKMTSSNTSGTLTTTIQQRSFPDIRLCYPCLVFISHLPRGRPQLLAPRQPCLIQSILEVLHSTLD
jgi:hypothetical protein